MKVIRERLRTETPDAKLLQRLASDPRASVRTLVKQARRRLAVAAKERARLLGLLAHERRLWADGVQRVAGVDEVGAGPLAGPVLAAAVILPPELCIPGIDDSKRLTPKRRALLSQRIREEAVAYAFGSCTPEEIDRWNILRASKEAMRRAVLRLDPGPEYLLVDARRIPGVGIAQRAIIGGDGASQSIAAASIIAKVERDALMERFADTYPGYGFERHRGYGTRRHLEALAQMGPSPIHRRSFAPVRAL